MATQALDTPTSFGHSWYTRAADVKASAFSLVARCPALPSFLCEQTRRTNIKAWSKHYNVQVVNNLSNRQNADNGLTTEKQGKKKRELEIVRLKMLRCSFFTMPMKLELMKHGACCSRMQNMSDNILCLE